MNGKIQEGKNQENKFPGRMLTWQQLTELLLTEHLLQLFKHLTVGLSWDSSLVEQPAFTSLSLKGSWLPLNLNIFSTLYLKKLRYY